MVPKANELHAKYAEQGLLVVGVTHEAAEPTEQWVKDKGVEYAYAYDRNGLLQALGVRGFPHAVLVDPHGRIVWRGSPKDLTTELVEEAVADAIDEPMWKWSPEALPLRQAIVGGRIGEALRYADELGLPEIAGVAELLESRIESSLVRLEALLAERDALGARALAEELATELDGLSQAKQARKALDRLSNDEDLLLVATDQQALLDALAIWPKNDQELAALEASAVDAALETVRAVAARHTGGKVVEQAAEALDRLEELSTYLPAPR